MVRSGVLLLETTGTQQPGITSQQDFVPLVTLLVPLTCLMLMKEGS